MKVESKKYDSNYTARGLMHVEFNSLFNFTNGVNIDEAVQNERKRNSFIGIATESGRKRAVQEMNRRLEFVRSGFWNAYSSWSQHERNLALFYLCLKTYPIVLDLHIEVALKKFRTGDALDAFSVQMRLDELAAIDEEVGSWSDSTLDKINSQYRTTLKDCGLLAEDHLRAPSGITDLLWDYFDSIGESWFKEMCFK